MNKSIAARKARRLHNEDLYAQRLKDNPDFSMGPQVEAQRKLDRLEYGIREDGVLHVAFGDTEFDEYTTGYNNAPDEGKGYTALANALGFTEFEQDANKKDAPEYGPKLNIRDNWKIIARIKDIRGDNETFYQLKDSKRIIILQTLGTDRGIRYLYAAKE